MKDLILQATLTKRNLVLLGTDLVPDTGLVPGNSISLIINCESEDEIRQLFMQLSLNGKIDQPLTPTFWGAWFGNLTDQFDRHWMLHYLAGS